MATNRVRYDGRFLTLDVSGFTGGSSSVASGTAVAQNELGGVVQYDAVSGITVIDTGGVYSLDVTANNTSDSSSSISVGNKLYVDSGSGSLDAGEITPDSANGAYIGLALESVSGGSDATINIQIGK